jgi:hypothetical protein
VASNVWQTLFTGFAYTGGPLERLVFVTPAFISVLLITFVTFWGARVSPAFTVFFICCYISYGWVKGIHSAGACTRPLLSST